MPSSRRTKTVIIALVIIFAIYYFSSDNTSKQFYDRTVAALDKKEVSDKEVAKKLQEVKDTAKSQEPIVAPSQQKPISGDSDSKSADPPKYPKVDGIKDGADVGTIDGMKSVAGRKTMKGGETKDLHSGKEAPMKADDSKAQGGDDAEEGTEEKAESKEDHEIETELNSILKRGPIIIFSKSYCPHSAKAKNILLEKYTIVPAPFVVELDSHPLGQGLQKHLEKSTGRRTVPNVLISGKSIGGGDDIQALDESGGLIDKVKTMGGKRIMEAKLTS